MDTMLQTSIVLLKNVFSSENMAIYLALGFT